MQFGENQAPSRELQEEDLSQSWKIILVCAIGLFLAVFIKISFDISINQLKVLLPEAEYKIQQAIIVIELK